jgi:F-type H+-transporting ATPase subunit epsilon
MATFHFELVSPDKLAFAGDVDQVDVPGVEGDFGVLAGHAPVVAGIRPGILVVTAGAAKQQFVVFGGLAEVSAKGMTVLAEVASSIEELDRGLLAKTIQEMEAEIEKAAKGDAVDFEISRLDHFKTVQQQLEGTAIH